MGVNTDLTQREQGILCLLAQGLATKTIAMELGLAQRTVETHRRNLRSKLGVGSTAELARLAVRLGLVPLVPSSPRGGSEIP